MDGAGLTVFEKIEQKLSNMGIQVDNSDLKEATRQINAKIDENPADIESKMIRLELKVVELSRLLSATVDVLESGHASFSEAQPVEKAPSAQAAEQSHVQKTKKFRINAATGVIEQVEDSGEDNVIVADGRGRFGGKGGTDPKKDKKCVFISAVDDEPVGQAEKNK
ncbi:MAG: hypothetical protein ACM3QV_00290 [Caulobacteraceae bacterium]